jgi:hypothetical protein
VVNRRYKITPVVSVPDGNGEDDPALSSIFKISYPGRHCTLIVRADSRKRVGKTEWSASALLKAGVAGTRRGRGKIVTPGDDNMPPGGTTEK